MFVTAVKLLSLALLLLNPFNGATPPSSNRIKNSSKSMISLWWINPNSHEYVSQSGDPIYPQSSLNIDSYETHKFAVVEEVGDCTPRTVDDDREAGAGAKSARGRVCSEARFVVMPSKNQVFKAIGEGESFALIIESDDTKKAVEIGGIIDECVGGGGGIGEGEIRFDSIRSWCDLRLLF